MRFKLTETENYNTLNDAKKAKLRTSQRHRLKHEPIHTNKNRDGTWTIIWALPIDAEHSSNTLQPIKRQMTRDQFEKELANEMDIEII